MSKPKYYSYTKEQMANFITSSSSMEEVLTKMCYAKPNDKRIIQSVRNYCDNLDLSHNHLPNILNADVIKCNICNEEKSLDNYYFTNGKLGQKVCKDCVRKRERDKHRKNKEFLNNYKKEQGCAKCGCKKYYLIDFHHINPQNKSFTISDTVGVKEETLLNEIKKCICLCSNCHREFHFLEKEEGITLKDYLWCDNV